MAADSTTVTSTVTKEELTATGAIRDTFILACTTTMRGIRAIDNVAATAENITATARHHSQLYEIEQRAAVMNKAKELNIDIELV